MKKHLVLLTSALYTNYGVFTPQQRIQQTLETAKSAKKYIPNATIVLIDNSKKDVQNDTSDEFNELIDLVDYYIDHSDDPDITNFHATVDNYDIGKNAMEAIGLLKAMSYISTDPELSAVAKESTRIFKLSGRYQLTDKFDIKKFDNKETKDKYVFKKRQNSWIPSADTGVDHCLQTRCWSFTPELLPESIRIYENIIQNMFDTFNQQKYIDNEHSMAKFIPKDKLVELESIGLQGNLAPNGVLILD